MARQISEGKKKGLQAVADSRGVIAALAIDQRSALRKLFAQAMNTQADKGVPFIYLSEGVSNETFRYALELAGEAGVRFSGVLCVPASWQGGVPVFVQGGPKALDEWLQTEGVKNIENVNQRLGALVPWCSAASETPLSATACRKGEWRP